MVDCCTTILLVSMSPLKEILAILAESYGVGPELPQNDEYETLSRLVGRLPTWFAHRGSF